MPNRRNSWLQMITKRSPMSSWELLHGRQPPLQQAQRHCGKWRYQKIKSAFRIESGTVNVNGKDLKEILLRHLIFQTFKFSTFWLFQTMFCFLSKNIWLRIHSKKLGKIFPLLFGLKMNKCKVQRSRRKMWSRFLGKSCLTPKLLLEGRCPRNPGPATAITTSRH